MTNAMTNANYSRGPRRSVGRAAGGGKTRRRARGFVLWDVVSGLTILSALALTLYTAVGRQRVAARKLADTRAAVRYAERVLGDLQQGRKPPALPPGEEARFTLRRASGGAPAGGRVWVEVAVTVRGRPATLVGLTRAEGLPE